MKDLLTVCLIPQGLDKVALSLLSWSRCLCLGLREQRERGIKGKGSLEVYSLSSMGYVLPTFGLRDEDYIN